MGESVLHFMVQIGLHDHFKYLVAQLLATADDPIIRDSLRSVVDRGTASIKIDGKILKQPDVAFGQAGAIPSLVCEVS